MFWKMCYRPKKTQLKTGFSLGDHQFAIGQADNGGFPGVRGEHVMCRVPDLQNALKMVLIII